MLTVMLLGSVVTFTESCKQLLSLVTGNGRLFMLENTIRKLATFIVLPLGSLKLTKQEDADALTRDHLNRKKLLYRCSYHHPVERTD